MKYGPEALAVADYTYGRKPAFGGEMEVSLTTEQALVLGEFEVKAANSGVWTADPVNDLPAAGGYIVAAVTSPAGLRGGDANVVLTVTGTNEDDAPASATATFAPPNYAENDLKQWPIGYGVDVELANDKKWKTITGVTVACEVGAKRGRVALVYMPDLTAFKRIGCTTDVSWTTDSRTPRPVACGMDAAAYTKPGRGEQPTVSISGKLSGFGDGLMKYDGMSCTMRVLGNKDGTVYTDAAYLIETQMRVKPTFPDGEGEATASGDGVHVMSIMMPAP